ncbi:GntR family transcriptional regulator [Parahaliea mediterranea]|uniref:GntR family transcriptional regulator n=1 Tax=Parahaliea mediterranea TaxID=651086 RepID=UPI0014740A01|nr:GntR family transcriptional regulator [Parahaliea mediterranea]
MTIAEQIKADLATHLRQGDKALPCKLTLDALAKHYGVSMTPVRNAVEDLVQMGAIQRLENGRLAPGRVSSRTLATLVRQPSLAGNRQNLEEAVRREVVQRSLRQDGEFLREQATAEQFGTGRTAVRQIFSRLAGAGMLEHVPRRGWRVKPYKKEDTLDYLVVRESLELKAMDLARPRFVQEELELLLAGNQSGKGSAPRLDDALHDYWIDRCGNRYIQEFFDRYSVFYNTLFNSAVRDDATRHSMAVEHCEIVEALLEKDWRGARRALSHHIGDQQDNVERMIAALRD